MKILEREFTVKQKLSNLKAKLLFMRFINRPTDTENIFNMTKAFQLSASPELQKTLITPLLECTHLREDFENQVWYGHPNMKTLRGYPEGSFGKTVADFFKANNLDEDLFPKADYSSLVNYITSRVYQTHDFWHVLTGYSIGLEDELALQAFSVGQYKQPLPLTIIAGGIIHIMQKHPQRAGSVLEAITDGYERGRQSKLLIDINIFQFLDQPITEVRAQLDIPERRPAAQERTLTAG